MQIITRRGLLLVGAGAAATWRSAAAAREVPRIGFIGPSSGDTKRNLLDAFRGGLKELGWTETDDVIILDRWPDERTGPLLQIAAELMGAPAI